MITKKSMYHVKWAGIWTFCIAMIFLAVVLISSAFSKSEGSSQSSTISLVNTRDISGVGKVSIIRVGSTEYIVVSGVGITKR